MTENEKKGLELISLARKTRGLEDVSAGETDPGISPLQLASLAVALVPHARDTESAVKTALEVFRISERVLEREEWVEGLRGKARTVQAACDAFERVHGPFPIKFPIVARLAGWTVMSGKNAGKKVKYEKAERALARKFTEISGGPGKGRAETRSLLSVESLKEGVKRHELEILIRHIPEIREYAFDLIEKNSEES